MHLAATTWLMVVAATVVYNTTTGQLDLGPARQRWNWGRRHQDFQPVAEPHINRAFRIQRQSQGLANRFARIAESNSHGTTTFKSITARTLPSSPQPSTNLVLVTKHEKPADLSKPQMKPSPVDTTHHINSHFEVIERVVNTPSQTQPKPKATIITPGEYPYPFDAEPVDLGDGTSIGGYIPDDTLPIDRNPVSNSHTKGPYKPPKLSEDHDTRYTTLDELFNSRLPTDLPDPQTLSNDVLGGLHPDEVFYADKDLVIIKGGGFHPKDSQKAPGSGNVEQEAQNAVKPEPAGNELGEANDPRITNVRPDDKFSRVPIPLRFVNGNIPTIVRPSSNDYQAQNRQFRPVHDTSFRPLQPQASRPFHYTWASSQHSVAYQEPPPAFQNLDEELMIAEPSVISETKVMPPTTRSTDPNVVGYHYQSRGTGSNAHAIVDYTIRRETSESSSTHHESNNNRRTTEILSPNQNFIRTAPEKVDSKADSNFKNKFPAQIGEEDFSVPEGGQFINLVAGVQTPRREPSPRPSIPEQPVISLEGDTRVNFLPPLPPINTQAQVFGNNQAGTSVGSNTHPQTIPSTFSTSYPAGLAIPSSEPARLANPTPESPVSLEGDTRVNFLPPLPPVNRQAEVVAHHPSVRLHPTGREPPQVIRSNPQVTRLTPELTLDISPQSPQTVDRRTNHEEIHGQKRFMEPRRRQITRQRPTPTL